jgi:Leucine-rich repeat (LRR) protein
MSPTSAHSAYRRLEAAHSAAATIGNGALHSGDLKALTSSTEELKRTTAEFREALKREQVEIPGKGRLIRAEYEVLLQLARENELDPRTILNGICRIDEGRIRCLDVFDSGLSSITALARLTDLRELSLERNQVEDLASLTNLRKLRKLSLASTLPGDLRPLANLTGLEQLFLSFSHLDDISPLANLTTLTELFLANNQIADITPLGGLRTLTRLDLDNNLVRDIGPLANLTGLRDLRLRNNPISSSDFKAVLAILKANGGYIAWTST